MYARDWLYFSRISAAKIIRPVEFDFVSLGRLSTARQ